MQALGKKKYLSFAFDQNLAMKAIVQTGYYQDKIDVQIIFQNL
jgi:hypothetical protein